MKKKQFGRLFLAILLPQLVGAAGAFFTMKSIPVWYETLNKPTFAPPSWVFAPVWTVLFILMGLAFYLVWTAPVKKKQRLEKKEAIAAFLTQLWFNFLWSFFFFGQQMPWVAFAEIVILMWLIAFTIIKFKQIKPLAAYLMLPYWFWVTFASLLNLGFALIN